jgi:hypothetical protein
MRIGVDFLAEAAGIACAAREESDEHLHIKA